MTKEELTKLADDEETKEVIFEIAEFITDAAIGTVETPKNYFNPETGKYQTYASSVKLMDVLFSIKDALWTIANNM